MTLEEIQREAGRFFSWPTDNKDSVTTTSACLFAHYILTKNNKTPNSYTEIDAANIRDIFRDKDGSLGLCVEINKLRQWVKLKWISKVGNLEFGWMPLSFLTKVEKNPSSELSELINELPQALRALPWQRATPKDVWEDGSVLLAAVPVVGPHGKTWWEFAVVTIVCDDDYFRLEVEGEEWGWNYSAIDLVIQIY